MASYSPATRELVLKIVYYGPGLGGKTTSLQALHAAVRPEHRGKMISLATPVDRTLYFDFLPVRLPSVGDLQLRLQLFTVPGQVYFNATRKLVLTGADAVVFVADSQEVRLDANTESLNNLRDNLGELGRAFEKTPIVLAYNKRDLPDVLSLDELDERLNPPGFPSMGTAAAQGRGVFEVLDAAVRLALDDLRLRRQIPPEVEVPADGIIAQRLSDVQSDTRQSVRPMRIVTGDARHSVSALMPSVSPHEGHAKPTVAPPPLPPPPRPAFTPSRAEMAIVQRPAAQTTPPPPTPALSPPNGTQALQGAPARRPSSLAPLFDAEDQETVRLIEDAIGDGILPRAVLLLEALLVRVLERAGRLMGRPDVPHEALAWSLGLPADRYLRVRAAAQRARRGAEVSRRDALEAYVVVSLAQLAAETAAR